MSASVLRVITRLNIGGPARQALLLSKALRDEFPTTLTAGTAPAEEGELADPEVSVQRVSLVRSISPSADFMALRSIRRLARHHRLVHTHMAKAGSLGRLAAASIRPRPVTVHTFHGHVLEGYFKPAVQKTFIATERALAKRTDVLIAVSEEVRESLLRLDIGDEERFRVIPLGFDLSAFLDSEEPSGLLRESLGVGTGTPLVGALGRLAPIKDHFTLLRAVARLPDVHLVLLGDGEMRGRLESEGERLGITDRLHMPGWWLDVPTAISDLDVTVLTSRNEGTPVSLIESLAGARPVVATDVGGVRTVVKDGQTGFLVPPGAPDETAVAIERLLSSPELRKTMGNAGRLDVRERFSQERLVSDIRSLYRELLT